MNFCEKCGKELASNATFCPTCGNLVISTKQKADVRERRTSPAPIILGVLGIASSVFFALFGIIISTVGLLIGIRVANRGGSRLGMKLSIAGLIIGVVLGVLYGSVLEPFIVPLFM